MSKTVPPVSNNWGFINSYVDARGSFVRSQMPPGVRPAERGQPGSVVGLRVEGVEVALEGIAERFGFGWCSQYGRGKGRSQGFYAAFENDIEDGYDAVEWLAAQQPVQFMQLAALALPADPPSFAFVPDPPAMEQQEAVAAGRRAATGSAPSATTT